MELTQKDLEDIRKIATPVYPPAPTVNKMRTAKTKVSSSNQKAQGSSTQKCWRCGGKHPPQSCPFKEQKCFKCQKLGHTKSQCDAVEAFKQRKQKQVSQTNQLVEAQPLEIMPEISDLSDDLNHLTGNEQAQVNRLGKNEPFHVSVEVENKPVEFEIDTGSPWSIVPRQIFQEIKHRCKLKESQAELTTYAGNPVHILGEADVSVLACRKKANLTLLVVEEETPLLGRDWIKSLGIKVEIPSSSHDNGQIVKTLNKNLFFQDKLESLLRKHQKLFDSSKLGKLENFQAKVYPTKDEPLFYKATPVSYAARHKIDGALKELESQGIIEPVAFSDYACPLVIVNKHNGKVRLCGNYKLTADKVLKFEQCPIPTLEDLMQDLQGGQYFSKLDLSHAYYQIE
ncbi:hypothetical protein HOLleu_01448 [Holothuria leucospilota]|uniref:CCHC-type domain-containing protein n=1 Tax=Holothuria leucospilota TaxID=206669 RepID=A0A9Q1CPC9_HOLLE|nr:hypothetical protein HOLleu_01448 [Holothuria leucospilota]